MSSALAAYEADLGGPALEPCEVELGGVRIDQVVEPNDGETLARAVRMLVEHDLRAVVRGGGTLDHFGNAPRRADLVLSMRGLSGVEELAADEGVVRVAGGTLVSELREAAHAEGWDVALDAPTGSTVGGALAAASSGPLALGYGAPRDVVLGLDVVLATGERTRCGGRVVKNVTGYDLAKLYTGSFGSLGVIEAAWLRLRPRPETQRVLAVELAASAADTEQAAHAERTALALQVGRQTSTACAALLSPRLAARIGAARPAAWLLLVALEGAASEVERDASRLEEWAPGAVHEVAASLIDALRELSSGPPHAHALRARLALSPSAVAPAVEVVSRAGADVVCHPALGILHGHWDEAGFDVATALGAVDAATAGLAGSDVRLRFDALPRDAGGGRDVFGVPEAELSLMRALKARFDPDGRLNPGRFAGRL